MADMNKALLGLEIHLDPKRRCADCPYYPEWDCGASGIPCLRALHRDLLAALKEERYGSRTFIVIDEKTGKEADIERIARREKWAAGLIYCDMEGWAIEQDGSLLLMDECGNFKYADRERFRVVWDEDE